ncbi:MULTISPECIES: metal-sensitive transcriptional regulator [unclassified Candidatus Frackibacter]|uniref:metal-sensitive transcriptional regulator n=1 Tax=unclassified Candidatus Frackibacter TaxID=2648818 RepID=UPI000884019F|nr:MULTISPECIES: metal-sensitive transcriptional regulator [unclassified Candidatus Frackibacter]SDC84594.1 DNA-binding transcriptional regulator, FrmR family [Candidatus Frackibacter sp. WG11]SEM99063.1 DNA-binding transcriptional regulator, FrmR family [Candidatus Frackibacter sp. WG12]SFM06955.1 DNA-binding transcriptional regulator, FrmR family [Candidatus Frackibacter sp. WG13]
MPDEKMRKDLINRLKTLKGHIGGIEKMIQEEKDCIDILIQISAIKSSINKVGLAIIENYAHECVISSIEEGEGVEDAVQEAIETVLKFSK